jgi:hypothetical protein
MEMSIQIWSYDLPTTNGKYIVKAKGPHWYSRENILHAEFNAEKGSWSFNNQHFIAYLT